MLSCPGFSHLGYSARRRPRLHSARYGLRLGWGGKGPMEYQIVGVVKNSKQSDLREQTKPYTYISALQYPGTALPDLTFYVRTLRNPLGETQAIERTVAHIDPSIPASNLKTRDMQIDETQTMDRLFAWLSISFAAAALLASIGLYGVMVFAVTRAKIRNRHSHRSRRPPRSVLAINDERNLAFGNCRCKLRIAPCRLARPLRPKPVVRHQSARSVCYDSCRRRYLLTFGHCRLRSRAPRCERR